MSTKPLPDRSEEIRDALAHLEDLLDDQAKFWEAEGAKDAATVARDLQWSVIGQPYSPNPRSLFARFEKAVEYAADKEAA